MSARPNGFTPFAQGTLHPLALNRHSSNIIFLCNLLLLQSYNTNPDRLIKNLKLWEFLPYWGCILADIICGQPHNTLCCLYQIKTYCSQAATAMI